MEGSRGVTSRCKHQTVETRGYDLVYGLGTNLDRSWRNSEGAVKVYDL